MDSRKMIARLNEKVIELTKKQIRSKILLRLKTQKEDSRERKSQIIKNRLLRTQGFKQAKIVMFYLSFDGEVNTAEMIKLAKRLGKKVAVPVCNQRCTSIHPCFLSDRGKLAKGPYGISEPVTKQFIDPRQIDLVVVPGVSFDKKGNRLGRGKGYYDRFLKTLPAKTHSIGLAFDFQILPKIPATTNDVSVNKVIFA